MLISLLIGFFSFVFNTQLDITAEASLLMDQNGGGVPSFIETDPGSFIGLECYGAFLETKENAALLKNHFQIRERLIQEKGDFSKNSVRLEFHNFWGSFNPHPLLGIKAGHLQVPIGAAPLHNTYYSPLKNAHEEFMATKYSRATDWGTELSSELPWFDLKASLSTAQGHQFKYENDYFMYSLWGGYYYDDGTGFGLSYTKGRFPRQDGFPDTYKNERWLIGVANTKELEKNKLISEFFVGRYDTLILDSSSIQADTNSLKNLKLIFSSSYYRQHSFYRSIFRFKFSNTSHSHENREDLVFQLGFGYEFYFKNHLAVRGVYLPDFTNRGHWNNRLILHAYLYYNRDLASNKEIKSKK